MINQEQQLRELMQADAKAWRRRQGPDQTAARTYISCKPKSEPAKAYAIELLQHVARRDADGRPVGLTLAEIQRRVIERYPLTTRKTPRRCSIKELQQLGTAVRRQLDVQIYRPRSPRGTA